VDVVDEGIMSVIVSIFGYKKKQEDMALFEQQQLPLWDL